jgi:Ca2+-binding RTX toxin-like protein
MATYTTNFSSWSDFEDRIAAFQDYEDSYAYQAVQNVAADLTYDLFFADPYSYTFSATSITAYYYGATAHLYGSNFGTASATVTRADITNGTYTLVLKGSVNVGGVNPTGTITSLDLSGGGYSEHAVGQIPLSGLNGVFSSWSNTYPTTLGSLTLAGTGTRTVSSSGNTTTTYSAISLADGAGNTTSLSGLKFTISDNSSTPVDYVELMRSLLGGNDTANGSAGNNELYTFAGNDTLDGKAGADTMVGGVGNDIYIVDNIGDLVVEDPAQGTDLVKSSIGYLLPDNVENLTLTATAAINATGNELANILTGNAGGNTLTGNEGNDTLNGGSGDDVLLGEFDETNLNPPGGGGIGLIGYGIADVLSGGSGNDFLDGGIGDDIMLGGIGNDTYVVTSTADVVSELANEGSDTVFSLVSYVLPGNVENLNLAGSGNLGATGNALNNRLIGNSGRNVMIGGAGNDTIDGGLDNDYLTGGAGADNLQGGEGDDVFLINSVADFAIGEIIDGGSGINELGYSGSAAATLVLTSLVTHIGTVRLESVDGDINIDASATVGAYDFYMIVGNYGNNRLIGNSGDNSIFGKFGNDTLIGGGGNDLLAGNDGNDVFLIGAGTDHGSDEFIDGGDGDNLIRFTSSTGGDTLTLSTHITNVQGIAISDAAGATRGKTALSLNAAAMSTGVTLTGNAAINTLTGGDGNDTLIGGAGADSLVGGLGDDSYGVDNALDKVTENDGEGTDSVLSSVTWTLAANLEHLTLTGAAAINATGNELANILTGNAAANILNGGIGADTMTGGNGNDTYVVDDIGDVVDETSTLAAGGNDLVQSAITYILGANLERLTLTGTAAIDGTGNTLANLLTGNTGNNTLDGGDGKDTLVGGLGDDTYLVDLTATGALHDVITEAANAGTDSVILRGTPGLSTPVTLTLAATLEHLDASATGTTKLNLTGNTLANTLTGNDADNTLTGGTGNDALIGGLGNDTYVLDNAGDAVTENADEGTDLVRIAIATANQTYILGDHVENGTLINTVAFNLTGNDAGNTPDRQCRDQYPDRRRRQRHPDRRRRRRLPGRRPGRRQLRRGQRPRQDHRERRRRNRQRPVERHLDARGPHRAPHPHRRRRDQRHRQRTRQHPYRQRCGQCPERQRRQRCLAWRRRQRQARRRQRQRPA